MTTPTPAELVLFQRQQIAQFNLDSADWRCNAKGKPMSEEGVKKTESPRGRALRLMAQQVHSVKRVSITIAGEVLEAEVRCPDIDTRRSMIAAYPNDPSKQNVQGVIECTYDPTTGVKMFESTDMKVMLQDPTGGFVDILAAAVNELVREDVERAQAAAKK